MEKSCREIARDAVKKSVQKEIWKSNWQFINSLRKELSEHEMLKHPLIKMLNEKQLSKSEMITVFLNFRPLVAKFTDVLLKSALLTYQLEKNLNETAKMPGRFLITLNILDELGFSPDTDNTGYYLGAPSQSHFLLFEKVLKQIGVNDEEKKKFVICNATKDILNLWENGGPDDLLDLTASLAATEMIALHFSPALRTNSEIFESLDLNSGYFYVHGSSEDESINAADDDHEDDLWYIAAQGLTPDRYSHFKKRIIFYMNKWVNFWDAQLI